MTKDLTIIILTCNSAALIKEAIERLDKNSFEIVVVDNASTDGCAEIVEKNFPEIKLIKLQKNIGYGRANNVALKQVKTKFSLVLNPDAFIEKATINRVIDVMNSDLKIALAGPIIYSATLENGQISNEKIVEKGRDKKSIISENNDFFSMRFVTGAAMFMNMELMKKIGFFDEGFFLYGEDNEICKRVLRSGHKIAIVKNTKFHHLSGKSSNLSQKELNKILWHKFGWSKCYYTACVYHPIVAKLKAVRMIIKSLFIMFFDRLNGRQSFSSTVATLKGSFGYLIGLKAFDKNDNPRG